jgi:Reverse transcriptase (RNA-dependent DNA polymerase)
MSLKAVNPDTNALADYKELQASSDGHHWQNSCSDEIGRLAQGRQPTMPLGTDTMHFIARDQIPPGRSITYLPIVCDDRPQKTETRRVRFTVGGDRVDYPFDVSTKTAALTTVKILLNSVISTEGAKFMTIDIKDFYLNTPMERYEYMRIPINVIPEDIVQQYNLKALEHNGYMYVEIRKGMYGLLQAGRIANDALVPYLALHGYNQSKHVHGLFTHITCPICFSLVVDDFGVKYVGQQNAQHLIDTLSNKYKITTNWTGTLYCGITLDWDYVNHTVTLSMPGYIKRALQRFTHTADAIPEHAPHTSVLPQYGAPIQYTETPDTSAPLNKIGVKRVQAIVGVFLYYARPIDSTMMVALNDIATSQAKATEDTAKACVKLLNCSTLVFTHSWLIPDGTQVT